MSQCCLLMWGTNRAKFNFNMGVSHGAICRLFFLLSYSWNARLLGLNVSGQLKLVLTGWNVSGKQRNAWRKPGQNTIRLLRLPLPSLLPLNRWMMTTTMMTWEDVAATVAAGTPKLLYVKPLYVCPVGFVLAVCFFRLCSFLLLCFPALYFYFLRVFL